MNQKRRLTISQVTMRQLAAATLCVAVGITCVRLSFAPRFAGGSVPNFFLIVLGLSCFVVVPIYHVIQQTNSDVLGTAIASLLAAIAATVTVLVFLILSGVV